MYLFSSETEWGLGYFLFYILHELVYSMLQLAIYEEMFQSYISLQSMDATRQVLVDVLTFVHRMC